MKIEQLEKASVAYYAGNPIMTDAEFDTAIIELRQTDPSHPFLKRIGAPIPGKEKAKHQIPMGSLDNANNEEEFRSWIPKNRPLISLSHKLDGSSLELIYQDGQFVQAITRGDGEAGDDVTKNVLKSGNIPLSIDEPAITSVRCECLIWKKDWENHFKGDANPRNSAAGTLRRHDGQNAKYLRFYAFNAITTDDTSEPLPIRATESEHCILSMLSRWFNVPDHTVEYGIGEMVQWCKSEEAKRDTLVYEIDGIVAKVDHRKRSQAMGTRDGRPRGQIAIKFEPRGGETVLNNVVWQVGHTGSLTPVGEVSPVGVGGTIIKRVTLCNPEEITRLDIAIGDTVEIVRAGDVIPKLSKLVKKGAKRQVIAFPKKCPECGSQTAKDGAKIFCTNQECPGQSFGRVMTWIKKRNILNIGSALVTAANVQSISHLYQLSFTEWANVEMGKGKLGAKRAQKVMDALDDSRSVSLANFLGSVGIKGVGRSLASDLCEHFSNEPNSQLTLSDIFLLQPEQLEKLSGFGSTRAYDFHNWLLEYREEIETLASYMDFENQIETKLVFKGDVICFTGKSPKTRPEMIALAESAGASVSSSVNSNTTILIIADTNSTSSKAVKARKIGIKLMSPEDFLNKIGV
jgi:DNA ligase (NAD+)